MNSHTWARGSTRSSHCHWPTGRASHWHWPTGGRASTWRSSSESLYYVISQQIQWAFWSWSSGASNGDPKLTGTRRGCKVDDAAGWAWAPTCFVGAITNAKAKFRLAAVTAPSWTSSTAQVVLGVGDHAIDARILKSQTC